MNILLIHDNEGRIIFTEKAEESELLLLRQQEIGKPKNAI